jgi:hypothetical protein
LIITKITGGLGNQMFEYAAGLSLAKKNNDGLKLDISAYKKYRLHAYGLSVFQISAGLAEKSECDAIRYRHHGFFDKAYRKITGIEKIRTADYIQEKSFEFDPSILSLTGDKYLEGYWQSWKYFSAIEPLVRAEFTQKQPMDAANSEMRKNIADCESVSLHVRRGDYVSDPKTRAFHGVDLSGYYAAAIERVFSKTKKPHFFIFSDEPGWVRENFKNAFEFTVVDINPPKKGYEDMRLMSACSHNITANSSFSWWGAWLNSNPEKIVTAPARWFNDAAVKSEGLYCPGWSVL